MSSSLRWRALLVLAVVAGATALAASRPVRLGLDLEGGTQIVLEASGREPGRFRETSLARARA